MTVAVSRRSPVRTAAIDPREGGSEREIVGTDATLLIEHPFLPAPDGPPPRMTILRDGGAETVDVPSVDDYRSEVDNLQAAILDGRRPRVDLASSRGTIETLVALDRSARGSLVHA